MSSIYDVLKVIGNTEIFEFLETDDLIKEVEELGYTVYDPDSEDEVKSKHLEIIGAVYVEDVDDIFNKIWELLNRGEIGEAKDLIDRWQNPKFSSIQDSKEQYELAIKDKIPENVKKPLTKKKK